MLAMEDEQLSDEETVEFDIEVVTSSSSASFELQDGLDHVDDANDQSRERAIDFCDGERESGAKKVQRLLSVDEQGGEQEVCERKYESDKESPAERRQEKEGHEQEERFKREPISALESAPAEEEPPSTPPLRPMRGLIDGRQEHSNEPRALDVDGARQQSGATSEDHDGAEATSELERLSCEPCSTFIEGKCEGEPAEDGPAASSMQVDDENQADKQTERTIPLGDTLGSSHEGSELRAVESAKLPGVASGAYESPAALDVADERKDDLTDQNALQNERYESLPNEDSENCQLSTPDGDSDVRTCEPALAESCLMSEPIQCPAGWLVSAEPPCLEMGCKVVSLGIVAALRVDAREQDQSAGEEINLGDADPAAAAAASLLDGQPEDELEATEIDFEMAAEPQIEVHESQHRMVDISVLLDEAPASDERKPEAREDGLVSPSLSVASNLKEPTSTDSDSQHSSSLALNHQQADLCNQVRRSSSAHLLALALDDEDLEREFDEEPEFEPRHVQVKRNRDPRDEYRLGDELGRGKFGTVYRCVEAASGRPLAAKFIHMRRREDREDVEREVAIMSVLQHKRLLQLYDAFDDGRQEMCLITELIEGGELFERIVDDDFDLTEKKAAIFMRQICEGVHYMHGQQIVHLDMKPENILCLSRAGIRIKLIDFGLARRLDPKRPIRVMFGTPDFAAPEVLAYETVSLATDMWSVGVICYVLLSGLSPFMGDNDMETMANVMRATFDFNDHAFEAISELAKDFISKLLVRDASERLKPAECLKHAWLARGGAPLEAAIRSRRESSAVMISSHHRLALEQAAMMAAVAAAAEQTAQTGAPQTPPISGHLSRASFGAESCASSSGAYSLDKRRLKRYVVRRKWHKTVHAIMALGRMGANLRMAL